MSDIEVPGRRQLIQSGRVTNIARLHETEIRSDADCVGPTRQIKGPLAAAKVAVTAAFAWMSVLATEGVAGYAKDRRGILGPRQAASRAAG